MKNKSIQNGIMLYAKTPGLTSFSSLWSIKHALNTEKLGHTGTLDSFAEGLLVVLSGNLTHLVPHITGFTKTYQAVVCFGKGTDTLDPTGEILEEGKAVTKEEVESVLPKFTGALLQTPPVYSALHVDGKRASDMIRDGLDVNLESRQVFIYKNQLLDFKPSDENDSCSYALLEITCSKGTYIRALARDIAKELGTVCHLSALRRTQVGPFKLEDAACYYQLKDFTIENGILNDKYFQNERIKLLNQFIPSKKKEKVTDPIEMVCDIKSHFLNFNPELASLCGFSSDILKPEYEKNYLNGRPLMGKMFHRLERNPNDNFEYNNPNEFAVFYNDGEFAGMIKINQDKRLVYSFVCPRNPENEKLKIFTWQEIMNGAFPIQWKQKGSALTVGSFDGVHIGHTALIQSVTNQKDFISGIVTFKNPFKNLREDFEGVISSSYEKNQIFLKNGLKFAIVIDFSDDFSKITGEDFIHILKDKCNLKFLSEGKDFKCGYKGSCTIDKICQLSKENDFSVEIVDNVDYKGQKVSSSRIRKEIINGNFSDVQKMLLRPFSYDVKGFKWQNTKTSVDEMIWFETKTESNQILPKNGSYNVVVIMSCEDKSCKDSSQLNTLHTVLEVENKNLKLLLPSENTTKRVKTINFIPSV